MVSHFPTPLPHPSASSILSWWKNHPPVLPKLWRVWRKAPLKTKLNLTMIWKMNNLGQATTTFAAVFPLAGSSCLTSAVAIRTASALSLGLIRERLKGKHWLIREKLNFILNNFGEIPDCMEQRTTHLSEEWVLVLLLGAIKWVSFSPAIHQRPSVVPMKPNIHSM